MRLKGGIEEVHWELTNHCNFKCVHCYLAHDPRRELNTEEIFDLLDQMHAAGVLHLTLSGGEPLLRKDFPQIYRKAFDLGFLINVFTNGSKIDSSILKLFTEFPPQKVEITMNGFTKETFEKVTAKEGSYEVVMEGIYSLVNAGVTLGIKTNGLTINFHEVGEIKKFAESLEGTFYKFDTAIMPGRDYDPAPTKLRLNPLQIHKIYRTHPDMEKQISSECIPEKLSPPEERKLFNCVAGSNRFHISAWGDLHPCHTVRDIKVSLLEMSFAQATREVSGIVESKVYPKDSSCGTCKIFSQCDSCPGLANLETKSAFYPTEYHCDVAHETVREFG